MRHPLGVGGRDEEKPLSGLSNYRHELILEPSSNTFQHDRTMPPPSPNDDIRIYTKLERAVDCAIHSLGLAGAAAGGTALIALVAMRVGALAVTSASIYIGGLVAMFVCSGVYNLWRTSHRGPLLQGFDHSAIFLMIAGSYTPFCVLLLPPGWSIAMTASVWAIALSGIAMRLFLPRHFARLSLALYFALGWLGLIALRPLIGVLDTQTLALLLAGGAVYSTGVIFHLWQRLPFQNAIWHGFVLVGAALHYFAVFNGVLIAGELLSPALTLPA